MIITLEGIDNCGKNSVADILIQKYPKCQKIDFPDYSTKFGQFIKSQLSDYTLSPISLQLLFSSERLSKLDQIKLKSQNSIIITTRYTYSAIAYGSARGIKKDLLYLLEEEMPEPDIKIFLSISPEESLKRSHEKDIFESDLQLLCRTNNEYHNIITNDPTWIIIDATQSIDKVFKSVEKTIERYIK